MAITAVLLAGGESRRMGRDKATLVWRGRPLWEWQLEKLRKLCPQKLLVSARSDLAWRPADVDLILDVAPSRGPLSGLAAALAVTETEHLLALAVDMAFITVEQLGNLCELVTSGSGIVPMINGHAEPLSAIYPKVAYAEFGNALNDANSSVQPVIHRLLALSRLEMVPISGADLAFYKSINEPRDLD